MAERFWLDILDFAISLIEDKRRKVKDITAIQVEERVAFPEKQFREEF
jgi:hypothetical protein